ncbi:uncharacterized protein LOC123530033 [Mercenaria mercenaria]|uniref:uncharacterized protein LOC123530033 n=1 Tax=Mercenaria mercenaria TaxID=6596 RepID=UPI00234F423E|nr:uncharacterized protein LOC123530033 [Mercenaria mercenaria]
MFRNFYAEQKMADPRDSWYKPNLLYNIHYRPPNPPTPPTPPKMLVLTREFNPSVCTCGEHSCVPHYRMEREVIWSSKKAINEAERELKEDIQAERSANAHRELKEDIQAERSANAYRKLKEDIQAERSANAHRELKKDIQAERSANAYRELKEDIQAERSAKAHSELKEGIQAERSAKAHSELKEDIRAERSAKAHSELKEDIRAERCAKAKIESIVDVDDDSCEDIIEYDDPKSKDYEEWKMRNDTRSRCSDRDGLSNSLPRFDDHSQQEKPDTNVLHTAGTAVGLEEADNEDFGSAFGIMSVYCDSELHTWNWKNEFP